MEQRAKIKMIITPHSFTIDADGTLFFHDYPEIKEEVPHAVRVLKRMKAAGHVLILHTCRHGEPFEATKKWLTDNGLDFDFFNENKNWESGSRKVYSNWDIDDHNLGAPLIHVQAVHHKPFVDWQQIEHILEAKGLL